MQIVTSILLVSYWFVFYSEGDDGEKGRQVNKEDAFL